MTRVSHGFTRHKRHRAFLSAAKGFRLGRKNVYKQVRLALIKQGTNAYRGRKEKKRTFRALWIERLNASLRTKGSKYSVFIGQMQKKDVRINRKVLSNIAIAFPEVFDAVYNEVSK